MAKKHVLREGVELAVKAAGSKSALARAVGTSRQAVDIWKKVPSARVIQIEQSLGVPREKLRPDLYPERAA